MSGLHVNVTLIMSWNGRMFRMPMFHKHISHVLKITCMCSFPLCHMHSCNETSYKYFISIGLSSGLHSSYMGWTTVSLPTLANWHGKQITWFVYGTNARQIIDFMMNLEAIWQIQPLVKLILWPEIQRLSF